MNRLATLACCPDQNDERSPKQRLLSLVAQKGNWNEADLEAMRTSHTSKKKTRHPAPDLEELKLILDTWESVTKIYIQDPSELVDVCVSIP